MVETLKRILFPKLCKQLDERHHALDLRSVQLLEKEKQQENAVNLRVASVIMRMDPFKPLMERYGGAFGEDLQRPEENLNEQGQMQMFMWGYAQMKDPSFKHFIQWVLDTEGNNMVKKGNPTPENILFSRAMIAAPLLMRREVQRLAGRYLEIMAERGQSGFDPDVSVE